jgi:ribosomal protein S4
MLKKKIKNKKIRSYNIHFSHKKLTKRAILSTILKLKSVLRKNDILDKIVLEREQISGPWYFYVLNQAKGMENLSEIIKDSQEKKKIKWKIKGIYKLKKRLNLESSLDVRFFKPWRYEIPFLTRKQSWLQNQYNLFKILSLKNRIDFFQTQIGQMMLASFFSFPIEKCGMAKNLGYGSYRTEYRFPVAKISNIVCRASLIYFRRINYFLWEYFPKYKNFISRKKIYSDLRVRSEKSWFYENTLRRKSSILFSKFKLTKFETAFHSNYREIMKRPWVEPLFFKRAALSAFEERYRKINKFEGEKLQYKFYLRNKNPRHIKRNRLYKRKIKLTANPWKGKRIMAHQSARIKQILSKLLRPFYGHLTLKQWTVLLKKNKKKRSKYQTRVQTILQHLENRLDVVVYRLNWAPSILWARRLIRGGFIFVTSVKKKDIWNKMYSSLKKYSFPLKLRDPKNLYSKTFWNPKRKKTKQFFFYISQKKISYLIQPGDILQCSRAILINQFKNNAIWLKKPLSSRFLSGKRRPKKEWRWDRHQILEKNFNNFEFYTEHRKSAVILSQIKLKNLPKSDRSNKFFLRWATV